jgi:DNA topoisomerase-1
MARNMHEFKVGEECELSTASSTMHTTTPPARFTEPQLVAKLEELGIGRPSTYANLVTVNQKRGYVQKKGRAMAPTWTGMKVAQILEDKIPGYVDYGFTASMEEDLDKIGDGSLSRDDFLDDVWKAPDGIDGKVNGLAKNIDWNEINTLSEVHLNGGYVVRVNRSGAWLEDPSGEKNDSGYVKSVKLDDSVLTDEDALTPGACRKLLDEAKAPVNRVLGILVGGPYAGWQVTARNGKYGSYVQAVRIHKDGSPVKSAKPVNMTLPKDGGLTEDTVTLQDAEQMFSEVKLPRQLGDGFFTGIGKRGAWLGHKNAPRGRAVFISLPDGEDPRALSPDRAKEIWDDYQKDHPARRKPASGRGSRKR